MRFLARRVGDTEADGGEDAEPNQPTPIFLGQLQELLPPQRHEGRHDDEMQRATDQSRNREGDEFIDATPAAMAMNLNGTGVKLLAMMIQTPQSSTSCW